MADSANYQSASEEMERKSGKDARRSNIMVIYALAQVVRSTLGPRGMDKLILDGVGNIVVTNDGYTLLTEMRVSHPAAKLAIEAAVTQQEKVGDGTTSVMVLAGELLRKADELIDMDIHPAIVARAFRAAEAMAQEILVEVSRPVSPQDTDVIRQIAMTAMTGKGAEAAKEHLADLTLDAVSRLRRRDDQKAYDPEDVKIERVVGGVTGESELVDGVLLTRERAHPRMPTQVRNARVAVIDRPIEIKDPEIMAQIQIKDPAQMQAFVDQEAETLRQMVARIAATGCNVLLCQENIEEPADYFLSKSGILAVRRVPQSDLVRVAKATGAKIVSSPYMLEPDDLGTAGLVREESRGKSKFIFVEECPEPQAVTILVKAGTQHATEEAMRALEDAMGDVSSVVMNGRSVGGAGCVEVQLNRRLRERARTELTGKERLVVEAYADSLLVIPRTLVESSGSDTIEVLAEMDQAHERAPVEWLGFDANSCRLVDCWDAGIIEPLELKKQALISATEVAVIILRIDDILIGQTS